MAAGMAATTSHLLPRWIAVAMITAEATAAAVMVEVTAVAATAVVSTPCHKGTWEVQPLALGECPQRAEPTQALAERLLEPMPPKAIRSGCQSTDPAELQIGSGSVAMNVEA